MINSFVWHDEEKIGLLDGSPKWITLDDWFGKSFENDEQTMENRKIMPDKTRQHQMAVGKKSIIFYLPATLLQ